MFRLDEGKLREAFSTDDESWVEPFDPIEVDADQMHAVVDGCLDLGIIEKPNPRASIAIYPLAISEPEPLLSVNPGEGPLLLGGSVPLDVGSDDMGDELAESIGVIRALIEAANALYAESEVAKMGSKDGGSEGERCENCRRVHGPLQACLIGVLAGYVEDRQAVEPITARELADIEVDPLWDRIAGPAVDGLEALIVQPRTAKGVAPGGGRS
jgi:hypothetical protein